MVFPRLVARPAWLPLLVLVTLTGCKTGQKLSLCSFTKPAKSSCASTCTTASACTSKPKVSAPAGCVPLETWKKCGTQSKPLCATTSACGPKVSCATTACGPTKVGCASKTSCAATCVPMHSYSQPQVQTQVRPEVRPHVQPKIVPKATARKSEPTPVMAKPKRAPAIAVPKQDEVTPDYDGIETPPFPLSPPAPPEPTTMNHGIPARTASNTSPFRQVIVPGHRSVEILPASPAPVEVSVATTEPVSVEPSNPFEEIASETVSRTVPVPAPSSNLSTAWADAMGLEDESQIRETPILSESLPEFRRGDNQPRIATPDGWRETPARVVGNIEEIPERN